MRGHVASTAKTLECLLYNVLQLVGVLEHAAQMALRESTIMLEKQAVILLRQVEEWFVVQQRRGRANISTFEEGASLNLHSPASIASLQLLDQRMKGYTFAIASHQMQVEGMLRNIKLNIAE